VKEVIEKLLNKNIICKSLKKIEKFGKVEIYLGVNLKSEYCLVVYWNKKSKFLKKDIERLREFEKGEINFRYKRKILILNSICKKAKEEIKDWRIIS